MYIPISRSWVLLFDGTIFLGLHFFFLIPTIRELHLFCPHWDGTLLEKLVFFTCSSGWIYLFLRIVTAAQQHNMCTYAAYLILLVDLIVSQVHDATSCFTHHFLRHICMPSNKKIYRILPAIFVTLPSDLVRRGILTGFLVFLLNSMDSFTLHKSAS